jgi:chitodextrinase
VKRTSLRARIGLVVTAVVVAAVAVPIVATSAFADTTCAPAWSATATYVGGNTASSNGVTYRANWWTRGDDPVTNNGASGTGQPWTSQGACGGSTTPVPTSSPTASPTPTPSPTGAACVAAWSATDTYTGGQTASEGGIVYRANWWTRGDEPATHNGTVGTGQPWTATGSCGGSTPIPTPTFSPTASPTPTPTPTVTPTPTPSTGTAPGFLFSPYKDATISMNWNTLKLQTAVTGTARPLIGAGGVLGSSATSLRAVILGFATGTCTGENWGGVDAASFAAANIASLDAAGVDYVISTGGAAGTFTCGSAAGLTSFIERYASSHLVGIDFDIEGGQSPAQISSLVASAAGAQSAYPNLRFSFTLATLAASDGSYGGLNSTGAAVVQAIQASSLTNYTVNLMTMDFGSASATNCVVVSGSCDMGRSAVQAAVNLSHSYGVPFSKIELTPMIGVNDVSSEVFTLADITTVANYAKSAGLAGVHFWSLDRDVPCATPTSTASATCNSASSGTSSLAYTNGFLSALS